MYINKYPLLNIHPKLTTLILNHTKPHQTTTQPKTTPNKTMEAIHPNNLFHPEVVNNLIFYVAVGFVASFFPEAAYKMGIFMFMGFATLMLLFLYR